MEISNEIKSHIVRESVPNFSGKLQRGSPKYTEAVQLADALGYDLVWVKRGKGGR